MHRTPTPKERAVASGLLSRMLLRGMTLVGAVVGVASLVSVGLTVSLLTQPWALACSAALIAAASILGFYAGVFLHIPFIVPLCRAQGVANGGPFKIGDTVQVIAGEHAGTVTQVYGKGQFDANRIDLGEGAHDNFTDLTQRATDKDGVRRTTHLCFISGRQVRVASD